MIPYRIGHGYDVHRVVPDRKLFLGCVEIPWEKGLLGHSDADVLCHAIADAMLGACGEGDIGRHFPDTDAQFEGVSGAFILEKTNEICRNKGYAVSNIDGTVIAQAPKLAAYIPTMQKEIARVLKLPEDAVNIKATTEEKLGFTGAGDGIAAHAVCLMEKI